MRSRLFIFLVISFFSITLLFAFQNCSEEAFDPGEYTGASVPSATPTLYPTITPNPTPVLRINGSACTSNASCASNRCGNGPGTSGLFCYSTVAPIACAQSGTEGVAPGSARAFGTATYICQSNGAWLVATPTPTPSPTPGLVQISGGLNHTCAINTDGKVYCWGDDTYGQVGSNAPNVNAFFDVREPALVSTIPAIVTQISSGDYHNCALTVNKEVYCWGHNGQNEIGDGTSSNRSLPVKIAISNVAQIALAEQSSCARTSDGRVHCWGRGYNYQLGNGSQNNASVPTAVTGLSFTKFLAGGGRYGTDYGNTGRYCVIKEDDTLHCWGHNYARTPNPLATVTNMFSPLNDVTQIALSSYHGCYVRADKSLYCWGYNNYSQLGNGLSANLGTPYRVMYNGSPLLVEKVVVGREHTCVISNNNVYCWGRSDFGQAGLSTTITTPRLETLGAGSAIPISIGAGQYHTCIGFNDSTIRCIGRNNEGQLGRNNTNSGSNPSSELVRPPFDL